MKKCNTGFFRNSVFCCILSLAVAIAPTFPAAAAPRALLAPLLASPAVVVLSTGANFTLSLADNLFPVSASLIQKDDRAAIPLRITGSAGSGAFNIALPKNTPPGLYSLSATISDASGATSTESAANAIWVLGSAPEKLVFAHIADTHTGDPRAALSKSTPPLTPAEKRNLIYKAASGSGAQFIIATGDLVSIPGNYKIEYPQAAEEITTAVTIPLFAAPGNHDLYNTSPTSAKTDGFTFWRETFAPPFYSFEIGGFAFVSMDTYDWPAKYRNFMNSTLLKQTGSYTEGAISNTQFNWLRKTLAAEKARRKTIIAFGHHPLPDNFAPLGTASPTGLASPAEVSKLLKESGVLAMLAGHVHFYSDMQRNGLRVITTSSASAQLPDGESWGYNLCTLEKHSLKCEFKKVISQAK